MADGKSAEVDLFGDPCRLPNGRRGRPSHRYSQQIANKITLLLAMGWSQARIAAACHLSEPTLRRHYFSVLKTRAIQRDRFDAWEIEKLFALADGGNVGAMKELRKAMERNDRMVAEARMPAPEPKSEKLGKKEQQRRAAIEAAGDDAGNWGGLLSGGYDA